MSEMSPTKSHARFPARCSATTATPSGSYGDRRNASLRRLSEWRRCRVVTSAADFLEKSLTLQLQDINQRAAAGVRRSQLRKLLRRRIRARGVLVLDLRAPRVVRHGTEIGLHARLRRMVTSRAD